MISHVVSTIEKCARSTLKLTVCQTYGKQPPPRRAQEHYNVCIPLFARNYDDFRKGYEKHHFDVTSYFKDRPNDFLLIDIIEGDGWEKLCKFLNCDIPDVAFPNTNPLKDIDKVAESLKMNKPNIVDGELIINELS